MEEITYMLTKKYPITSIQQHLQSKEEFQPYPAINNREKWGNLPTEVRHALINEGENFLDFNWPSLTASMYMEYKKTGNRVNYETPYFLRRRALTYLVLAECVENNGRFIDDIINGIWSICEETTWVVPAHAYISPDPADFLPNKNTPVIDLFAAETANTMSWVYYLLQPALQKVSQIALDRIYDEVKVRVLDPYLERTDFWWMGYDPTIQLNNWTPWCTSNCLSAFLLLDHDQERRIQAIEKSMFSIDRFLDTYLPDGGCDEGPQYWGKAGGSLFDALDLLDKASNGKINVYHEPLVKNIGAYIYQVHVHDTHFVNVADGAHQLRIEGDLLYRYGEKTQDKQLMALGSFSLHNQGVGSLFNIKIISSLRIIPAIFNYETIQKNQQTIQYDKEAWLQDTQLMITRENHDTAKGLFLACKGGHNDESHNHNDIGNFIIYANGKPVFIDVGVETYTLKTFSPERYSLWTMQSAFHNTPTINNHQQKDGRAYQARNVNYLTTSSETSLSMDLSQTYPQEADIEIMNRSCKLVRSEQSFIEITDHMKFAQEKGQVEFHFMTCRKPIIHDGKIILQDVEMLFDGSLLSANYETIDIQDKKLRKEWGAELYRITLTSISEIMEERFNHKIQSIK